MKSVLIITPSFLPEIGGVETRFNDICNELDKRNYTVIVLTYQPIITRVKGLSREKRGNITIYRFWWIGFDLFHKLKPYPLLQVLYLCPVLLLCSVIFLMRNFHKVNIIHTAGFAASLIGRILKKIFKKRWVVSTHAIYDLNRKTFIAQMIRWILSSADAILTLSEPSRQELINIGVDKEKITNQITWVDQNTFKPLDRGFCRKNIRHTHEFIILFVGRLLEIKGIKDVVSVAEDTPFIDYIFIGDGPLCSFLKAKSLEKKNIIFLSRVENKDLSLYYNAADIFIMPSQYKEGLGRVVVEALSCATPVIASNLGGLAWILDASVAVMINPTKENIKSAILDLYHHPDKLVKMRNNCRDFAMRNFSANNVDVIINAYKFNNN